MDYKINVEVEKHGDCGTIVMKKKEQRISHNHPRSPITITRV